MLQPEYLHTAIFFLPTNKGIELIDVNNIVRIQSISNYSKLYFNDGKTLVVAKVLTWFENKLPGYLFVRVHRSHLISLHHVQTYCNNQSSKLILYDNTAINISRRKKRAVMKVIKTLAS